MTMYGWYSEEAEKRGVAPIKYSTPSGGTVEVTLVSRHNRRDLLNAAWPDLVCLGEVDKFLGNPRAGLLAGLPRPLQWIPATFKPLRARWEAEVKPADPDPLCQPLTPTKPDPTFRP